MIFRLIIGLLLLAALLCFGLYIGTQDVRWRRRGVIVVKWAVLAGLGFFAVVLLERLTVML